MVRVIATITVKPGRMETFLPLLKENVPNVLAEDGCHGYAPTRDLETDLPPQIPLRPDVVTLVEAWESLDHLEAHLRAPHMKTYKEATKEMVENVSLQVLEDV